MSWTTRSEIAAATSATLSKRPGIARRMLSFASESSSSVGPSRRRPSSSLKASLIAGPVLSAKTAAATRNGPAP
ncbi:MAG: hypothetical protein KIS78_28205 [Labilithrix sp.]|nr:hypothetical protein [Labilithrix sp.]